MTDVAAPAQPRYDRSIVEGPLQQAVWKIAWPTMLTNAIGGLQGIVDHVLVGNLVGYKANAAIGVSWQIFLVVIIFISSLFSGMSVLVARFAGAGDAEKVDRVVCQAFLTAIGSALGVMRPLGYFATPWLLDVVNAAPAVKAEAMPYLRILFGFSSGMLIFFMLGGALRSAGDARTPMQLGMVMTVVNLVLNVMLIRGLGPIPAFGTRGSAMGTCITSGSLGASGSCRGALRIVGGGVRGTVLLVPATAVARRVRNARPGRREHRCPTSPCAQRFRVVRHCGAVLHGGDARDRRYEESAVHLDDLADPRAARDLFRNSANWEARRDRHLARHSRRACDALRAERAALPSGEVAHHCREYWEQLTCDCKCAPRIVAFTALAAFGHARTGNLFHQRFPQLADLRRFR